MTDSSHLQTIFSVIDEGYCLCEMIFDAEGHAADYRFLEVNSLFAEMTGLVDATGRTALDLVPGLEAFWIETYARVAAGEVMRFESGSEQMGRFFDVFATPVKPEGRFALIFRDISARRQAEAEREAARARAESLLAELNHRVMNTLAMISSIMRMERRQQDDQDLAAEVLDRMQNRLHAVSALYRALNSTMAETDVAARAYLTQLTDNLSRAIADKDRIRITANIADVMIPTAQAAPLGLILNELVTNALKYAFPGGRNGTVTVTLASDDNGQLQLTIADDGVGMDAAADTPSEVAGHGNGALLIAAFADQLSGELVQDSGPGGTRVALTFPAGRV